MTNLQTREPSHQTNALLRDVIAAVLLIVVLLIAAALRFTGIDWDERHLLHPDERFLSWVVSDMYFTRTVDGQREVSIASWTDYFDTINSTLNPNNVGHQFYVYGDLPVIMTRYIAERIADFARQAGGLPEQIGNPLAMAAIALIGRAISATFDLVTIVLIYLAARRLFDWRVGLLASALYAGVAFAIQQAHFFTVDAITNTFVVACLWFAARALARHRWVDYPLFGLSLGLAAASKVSIAPLALVLVVALMLRLARELSWAPEHWFGGWESEVEQPPQPTPAKVAISRAIIGLATAGLVSILTFRVGQPYAFLPPNSGLPIDEAELGSGLAAISRLADPVGFRPNPKWIAQMQEIHRWVTGKVDSPPNHQWAKRLPLVFPWTNMVRVGMGWPLGIFAWLAFVWAWWEIGRGHRGAARLVVPVVWIAFFFTWQGVGWVTTMRYFLPLYPFLLMLAAWAVITIWDRVQALLISRGLSRWHRAAQVSAGLGMFVLGMGLVWGWAVSRIYTRPVTRIAASRWIVEHVPSDITLIFNTAEGPRQYQLGLTNDWLPPNQDPDSVTQPGTFYSRLNSGSTTRLDFTLPFDGTLIAIRLNHVVDPSGQVGQKTINIAIHPDGDMVTALASGNVTSDFAAGDDPRGQAYQIDVTPVALVRDRPYTLVLEGDPATTLVLAGSTIADEGTWDDPVPVPIAPYNMWGAQYQSMRFEMALEDTPEKRARMQYILDHADYLTISSNRFYGSLPRNPQRWPMTTAYYQALFNGELGYELVADFTSRPNLGPIQFNDDSADEAWTVYDHPRVFVFRRAANYDPERVAAVLNSVNLDTVVRKIAGEAEGRPVIITPPRPGSHPGALSDAGFLGADLDPTAYDPAPRDLWTRVQPLAVIVWWLILGLIGWIGFLVLWVLFPGLADRGYTLGRTFGLLFSAWLAWMMASVGLLRWSGGSIALALLVLATLAVGLTWSRRGELLSWLRVNRRYITFVEATLAALFLLFVLIRWGNPDLWHPAYGGEKPMDLAYFNAVLRSDTFPPYDPWFAGETINYYYFGFVVVAVPVKLLAMHTTLAYNLILPTLFALTGIGAFSAAYNLVAPKASKRAVSDREKVADSIAEDAQPHLGEMLQRWPQITPGETLDALCHTLTRVGQAAWQPYAAGIAALLLAIVLGNLDEIRTTLWGLAELGSGKPEWTVTYFPNLGDMLQGLSTMIREGGELPVGIGEWYWNATRVIPVPIDASNNQTEVQPITEFPFFTFLYADLHAHMIAMPLTLLVMGWCVAQVRGAVHPLQEGHPSWIKRLLDGFIGALAVGALRPTNTWDYPTYLLLVAGALMLTHFVRRQSEHAWPALGAGSVLGLALGGLAFAFGISSPDGAAIQGLTLPLGMAAAGLGLLIGFGVSLPLTRQKTDEGDPHNSFYHWLTLLGALAHIALVITASTVLYLPYIQHYMLGYDRAIPWTGSRTALWAYIDIHGLFLFVVASWMIWEIGGWLRGVSRRQALPLILALTALGGATVWATLHVSPVAAVAVPLIVAALGLFFRPNQTAEKRMALIALMGALALTLLVEVVVLEGDISRMNTVFKFYIQVWILLAVVGGAALGWLWPELRRARDTLRIPWLAALIVLLFLAALYPLMATRAKVADRWNPAAPHTLDGMAYMPTIEHHENSAAFSLAPDYAMLRWLQDHVQGNPVIAEALSWREYLWGNRVSVYTGLPAVIGWNWHQRQQRPPQAEQVGYRRDDVGRLYNTSDPHQALEILDRYNVDLIIVGELERAYYQAAGLEKFRAMAEAGMLTPIYDRDGTVVYRVNRK